MKIAYLDILYDGNDAFEEIATSLNQHAPESVHVDYHAVANEDVAAVLTVEVNVNEYTPSHAAEQLFHYATFLFNIRISRIVKLARQPFRLCRYFHYFRVTTVKRLSGQAFFKFRFHS